MSDGERDYDYSFVSDVQYKVQYTEPITLAPSLVAPLHKLLPTPLLQLQPLYNRSPVVQLDPS